MSRSTGRAQTLRRTTRFAARAAISAVIPETRRRLGLLGHDPLAVVPASGPHCPRETFDLPDRRCDQCPHKFQVQPAVSFLLSSLDWPQAVGRDENHACWVVGRSSGRHTRLLVEASIDHVHDRVHAGQVDEVVGDEQC